MKSNNNSNNVLEPQPESKMPTRNKLKSPRLSQSNQSSNNANPKKRKLVDVDQGSKSPIEEIKEDKIMQHLHLNS